MDKDKNPATNDKLKAWWRDTVATSRTKLAEVRAAQAAQAKAGEDAAGEGAPHSGAVRSGAFELRRIEPLSALRVGGVLSVAVFCVWFVAMLLLWMGLSISGVWEKMNSLIVDITGFNGISAGRYFLLVFLVGLLETVVFTVLAPVGALIYNAVADSFGGLRLQGVSVGLPPVGEEDAAVEEKEAPVGEEDTAVGEEDTAVGEKDTAVGEKDTAVGERAGDPGAANEGSAGDAAGVAKDGGRWGEVN